MMTDIHRMLIQLFDHSGLTYRAGRQIESYPPTNWIKKSPTTYLLQLALAGFKRDELEVSMDDRFLIIKGQKAEEPEEQKQWSYAQHGIGVRSFAKAVTRSHAGFEHFARPTQYVQSLHMLIKGRKIQKIRFFGLKHCAFFTHYFLANCQGIPGSSTKFCTIQTDLKTYEKHISNHLLHKAVKTKLSQQPQQRPLQT